LFYIGRNISNKEGGRKRRDPRMGEERSFHEVEIEGRLIGDAKKGRGAENMVLKDV